MWRWVLRYIPTRAEPIASMFMLKGKGKGVPNRPGVAQRVPGVLGSQMSMTFGTWRWWGCQPHAHRPPLPQEMFLLLIFTRAWVDPRANVRSEGNMSLKNPVTPPGIDPGTVRLVKQRLNHYATPGTSMFWLEKWIWKVFRTNLLLLLLKLTIKQIAYFDSELSVSCYEIRCGTKFGGVSFEAESNKLIN